MIGGSRRPFASFGQNKSIALLSTVPEDNVAVSFRDPRGNQWRNIGQGSPGQQTAALLAFVLGYGSEPILLDQPEDDLDNTLIYELLVQRIRGSKQTRQIVVVTHNPNIVVHGDAELVISLEAIHGQSKVRFAGGLQVASIERFSSRPTGADCTQPRRFTRPFFDRAVAIFHPFGARFLPLPPFPRCFRGCPWFERRARFFRFTARFINS
jgi:hypothetical protein